MSDQDVKARAKEIISKSPFTAFATLDEHGCPQSRAMMPVLVDDDFTVCYITSRARAKCGQIDANPKVSSLWTHVVDPMKEWSSLLIKGKAAVSDDRALKERFWIEELREFFPTGIDDPNYVIIVCKPTELIVADQSAMTPLVMKL